MSCGLGVLLHVSTGGRPDSGLEHGQRQDSKCCRSRTTLEAFDAVKTVR